MVDAISLIGIILFLGFLSLIFFEKTKISEVLLLIGFGLLIGPIAHIVRSDVDPETGQPPILAQIAPFMSTVALIFLLFDSGLNLSIYQVVRELGRASLFTFVIFVATMFLVGITMQTVVGWNLLYGLLLGAIVGGTSSAIVVAMVEKTKASKSLKTVLILESTLTDILVVVFSFLMFKLITEGSCEISTIANFFVNSFLTSAVIGAIVALVWVYFFGKIREWYSEFSYSYMLTVAVAFLLYSFAEFVRANGNFAVFVFGLTLGNLNLLPKSFKERMPIFYLFDREIKSFQEEITFFIRTFFFVYIGVMFPLFNISIQSIVLSLFILLLVLLVRFLFSRLILGLSGSELILSTLMMARGLAAAVMVSILAGEGIHMPMMNDIALGTILLTNVVATLGVYLFEKTEEKEEGEEERKGEEEKESEDIPSL